MAPHIHLAATTKVAAFNIVCNEFVNLLICRGGSRVWKGVVHFAEKIEDKKKVAAILAVLYQMCILYSI